MFKKILFSAALALSAASAQATTLSVDGTDAVYNLNAFGGGYATPGGSTEATSFGFSAGAGQVLVFNSVTGLTNCCGIAPGTPADGDGTFAPTSISALNGISAITAPNTMFLAGVFINSAALPTSGAQPAGASYSAADLQNSSYSPLLNQVFFIGDGRTNLNTTQAFNVSSGADTLLLGFVDGFAFNGAPNAYGDNTGALTVDFEIGGGTAPVPLPAGLPLLLGALGAFGLIRRRS